MVFVKRTLISGGRYYGFDWIMREFTESKKKVDTCEDKYGVETVSFVFFL